MICEANPGQRKKNIIKSYLVHVLKKKTSNDILFYKPILPCKNDENVVRKLYLGIF